MALGMFMHLSRSYNTTDTFPGPGWMWTTEHVSPSLIASIATNLLKDLPKTGTWPAINAT